LKIIYKDLFHAHSCLWETSGFHLPLACFTFFPKANLINLG
jgi:hypothetical protein